MPENDIEANLMRMQGASRERSFKHGEKYYQHYLFFNVDDRVELVDEDYNHILTYTANCCVVTPDGKTIGHLRQKEGFVHFISMDEKVDMKLGDVNRDMEVYLNSEVPVSKWYLDQLKEKQDAPKAD